MSKFLFIIVVLLSTYEKSIGHPLGIVGGNPVNIEDYPYQVSMLFRGRHACGGSILNENFILTAAHCTFDGSIRDITIRVGSSIINSGGKIYNVAKINYHEKFNIDTYDFDVSVLKLTEPIAFEEGVQPISLIAKDTEIQDGQSAVATGWGRISTTGPLASQLQQVDVPTISTETCQGYYGKGIGGVTKRMFCAGDDGKDTCMGDSGGPLVIDGVLAGITSWGDICGQVSTPGVYTKISIFRNYIDEIMNT
ncbi:unnamed protein product [Brassicogethes aeneus]|uniref:Peptidase S1 domain-containing protein n=1 Tax=Brassicogethes aeneus TaxID=1431903 RepID=A0A9P0FG19_BRAAE|nr:unnamed protein product [Brassicogethes aeneus]